MFIHYNGWFLVILLFSIDSKPIYCYLLKRKIHKYSFLFITCVYLVFVIGFKGNINLDHGSYNYLLNSTPIFKNGIAGINRYYRVDC